MNKNIFKNIALDQIPRILGFCDRDSSSYTFGCFDRTYWHYKLIDVSNVRYQEASFLLALLYKKNLSEVYYKNPRILSLIKASIDFFAKVQNKDGSFNEVYPFERSFCASSFALSSVLETMHTLNTESNRKMVKKGAEWLMKNKNIAVSNQSAASALALLLASRILDNNEYYDESLIRVTQLSRLQDNYGFYPEYNGFDFGYQSITLGLLTRYNLIEKRLDFLERSIKKGAQFLSSNLRSDGSYDNQKTYRKTQFIYPLVFSFCQKENIKNIIKGLLAKRIISPLWMDDRYVIPLTTDYLMTDLYLNEKDL